MIVELLRFYWIILNTIIIFNLTIGIELLSIIHYQFCFLLG